MSSGAWCVVSEEVQKRVGWEDDVTIDTAIQHLSLEETMALVRARGDVQGIPPAYSPPPISTASTIPAPLSTLRMVG